MKGEQAHAARARAHETMTELSQDLSAAAQRLRRKLQGLDLAALGLSPYMTAYVRGVIASHAARLSVYEYLLRLALDGQRAWTVPCSWTSVAGTASSPCSRVSSASARSIYVDIFAGARDDATALGAALGLTADHYIVGDSRTLLEFVERTGVVVTAVCSNDVIEHVYDLDQHIDDLAALSAGALRLVMASEANGANPRIRRRTVKMQREVETRERSPVADQRPLDSTEAYLSMRARTVRETAAHLTQAEVGELASRTRGMIGSDVERATTSYVSTGVLPASRQPTPPTRAIPPQATGQSGSCRQMTSVACWRGGASCPRPCRAGTARFLGSKGSRRRS